MYKITNEGAYGNAHFSSRPTLRRRCSSSGQSIFVDGSFAVLYWVLGTMTRLGSSQSDGQLQLLSSPRLTYADATFRVMLSLFYQLFTHIRQAVLRPKQQRLTPSAPAVPNCCSSKDSAPYWSNPLFLIFDIRALWRSVLSARAPECHGLKIEG